jgi:tRNA-intron endonuclease
MVKFQAHILGSSVSSNSAEAFSLYKKSNFGEPIGEKVRYSLPETLFLVEKGKIDVFSQKKKVSFKNLIKKFQKMDKRIYIKYPVFRDFRERGYIVKTALKFGADFRVYEKGAKPGKKHAKWIVFADHESKRLTWHEFSAKNRVAHSTRKNLILAIVDEEEDVSYYEVKWVRP